MFFYTYIITFIIFYAISLIGNCVEIFSIINSPNVCNENDEVNVYNIDEINLKKQEDSKLYDEFRISTIEAMIFSNKKLTNEEQSEAIEQYKAIMLNLINQLEDDVQRERLKKKLNKFFEL